MANIPASCALVLWDERLSLTDREPNTGATLTSDFTETGRRPGLPVRAGRLLAQVSGDQDATVVVEVPDNGPGLPGRDGCRVVASTDNGATQLGHMREGYIRYWDLLQSGASLSYLSVGGMCTDNGTPLVVMRDGIRRFDGSSWTVVQGFGSDADGPNGVDICQDPVTGILVCVAYDRGSGTNLAVRHSTDDGQTWSLVSSGAFGTVTPAAGFRIALGANRGGIVALFQTNGSTGDVIQFASSDLGLNWTQIDSASADGLGWSIVNVEEVLYAFFFDPATTTVLLRRVTSPYESIIAAADVSTVSSRTSIRAVAAWSDVSGRLWCMLRDDEGLIGSNNHDGKIVMCVSYDNGITWEENGANWVSKATNAGPANMVGMHTPYGALVACNGDSPGSTTQDESVHLLWLGGWSSAEPVDGAPGASTLPFGDAFAPLTSVQAAGMLWLPFSQPGATGFVATGGGTVTFNGSPLGLLGQRYYTQSTVSASVFWDLSADVGGSVTNLDIGVTYIFSSRDLRIRYSTTQFRLYDAVASSILATVDADMTQRMQFYATIDALHYRRPTDETWTRIDYTLTSGSPGAAEFSFGQFNTGTQQSTWYAAGVTRHKIDESAIRGRAPACYLPPSVGVPSILTLTDGPGLPGDQATIVPLADYSIEYLDPARYPSPDTRWRSTQEATSEDVVWDLGIDTQVGRSVALVVAGGSFRLARASYWDGAAWQSAGTIDLATGFTGLSYEIAGDILEPDSGGTAAAARYIAENELVGGHVVIAGTPNTKHRILANGPGLWADGSGVVPWIRVDDAAAIPATGTVNIVCPGGVMVASPAATVSARYWRLRFVGGQGGPGDVFEAGTAWIGRLLPMGAVPDWTWTDTSEPNVSRRMDSYGTARARELGPVRRSWTWSWADGGADLFPLRDADAANLDAVKVPGGRGIVAGEDVWMSLRGALQTHQALPVAALRKVPADGITITDPTLWLYGYLDGSVSARGIVGTEGENEVVRIESITIRENV